jgi:hypothetical protein
LNGIYSIEDAQLFQCFHDGFADGTAGLSAKKLISSEVSALVNTQSGIVNKAFGWGQFRTVFTASPMPAVNAQTGGYIYMVTADGLMLRFRHTGFQTGEPESGLATALQTPPGLHESWSTLLHLFAARM